MPTARKNLAVAASGTKLFAVGGKGRPTATWTIFDTLEIYESATDSWSAAAPMPTLRYGLAAAIVGNTLFALSSYDLILDAYDIEGASWSTADPMTTPRNGLAAVAGP